MDAHVQCTALAERSRAPVPLQTPPPPASYHAQRTQGDAARPPRKRRHGGRRAKRQHRALALAAAIEVTTSEAAPATRGAPGHGCSPDAIEAAALAAALAESALESESEEHKAVPWEYTPSHLCNCDGLYDPDLGSDNDFDNPHGGCTSGLCRRSTGAPCLRT
jgi:hypothetical protein